MSKKLTVKDLVTANFEVLKEMNHGALFQWSRDNGLDSKAGFSSFKKALLSVGMTYDALRAAHREAKAEALASAVTHEVTFYSDAKARCERFAICDRDGKVVWFGRFFDGEGSEQSAAELEAAKKAIWLAGKVRQVLGAEAIRLTLRVDAKWLTTLSGKAACLADAARKNAIELAMEWIPGTQNPADKWTVTTGFQKWSDVDLAPLATKLS